MPVSLLSCHTDCPQHIYLTVTSVHFCRDIGEGWDWHGLRPNTRRRRVTADAGAGLPQPLTGPGLRVARGRVTPGASHDVTVHSSKHHHDIKNDKDVVSLTQPLMVFPKPQDFVAICGPLVIWEMRPLPGHPCHLGCNVISLSFSDTNKKEEAWRSHATCNAMSLCHKAMLCPPN